MKGAALSYVIMSVHDQPPGEGPPPERIDGRMFAEAADLADRNGLYYPFMQAWIARGGLVPPTHRDRWAREQTRRECLVRTLNLLNDLQRETDAEYAVIKDTMVPNSVPNDVDIFVPPDSAPAFLAGIRREGLVPVFDNEAERSFAGPETMRIDVYNRIQYLGRDFIPLEFLWSARVAKRTHGVEHPGLNASAAFLVNSIHGLLGHAGISLLDFLDFCSLRDTLGDLSSTRAHAAAAGWGPCFDRWVAYIEDLRNRVTLEHEAVRFPVRHGHRLIRTCLSGIDGGLDGARRQGLLELSLIWDDLVFYSEDSGLSGRLRRSRIASAMANAAGHRLRAARGDRKTPGGRLTDRTLNRTRTRFR